MHLKARNVSVHFGPVHAVRSVTLEARPGEILGIFGANGSGKTTFLKAVAGLVPVVQGRIVYHGEDITRLPPHERVSRGIHYVSDRARVALKMTVRENLDVGGYLRTAPERAATRSAAYDLFPVLREKERAPAGILSGGERQMLVIGRALMARPTLLLFDEPLLGLARELRDRIVGVIGAELRPGRTILLAEHDVEAAFRVLDRYCIFLNGALIHEGSRKDADDEGRLRGLFRKLYGAGAPADTKGEA